MSSDDALSYLVEPGLCHPIFLSIPEISLRRQPPSLSPDQDKYDEYKERRDRDHGSRPSGERRSGSAGHRERDSAGHRERDAAGRERAHRRPVEDGHRADR